MSAFDPDKLEAWEVAALVNYTWTYIRGEMQDPSCPQLKPIMANDKEILYFSGKRLYDRYQAEAWAKKFLAWKGTEAERRRLAREERQREIEESARKQEQELAAIREQQAFFRAQEEDRRRQEADNQADAFKRSGTNPEVWRAEQARLRSIGM